MNYSSKQLVEFIGGECELYNEQIITHVSTDSRSLQNTGNTVFFALVTEKRNGHNFIQDLIDRGVKTFVVSQGIEFNGEGITIIKVSNTLEALQSLAANHRKQFDIPVIGITGSYGKTIVKEWLYQLLSTDYNICRSPKSFNSQLGVSLSILLLDSTSTLGIFEAGISESGEMEKLEEIIHPTIGVLTKMGEAHQSGFNSFEQKLAEKKQLFLNSDIVIELSEDKQDYDFPFSDKVSIENCSLCIKVLEYLGYEKALIQERINSLSSITLRLEMINGIHNSTILNDGYNISYSSLALSVQYLNQLAATFPKTLIISQIPESNLGDERIIQLINSSEFTRVLVVGEEELIGLENKVQVDHFKSTEELISQLSQYDFRNHFVLIKGARKFRFEQIAKVLEEKNHRTQLEIDLNQLSRNLDIYRNKIKSNTKLMVMVKAFSYGTGAIEIPRLLEVEGVDYLGVAYTDEGIVLRNSGIKIPIMVMNPEPGTFADLIKYELEPEVYSLEELDELVKDLIVLDRKEYPIHIKLETGMNRLGFIEEEIPKLIQYLKSQPEVYVKSIFSHLSSADDKLQKEFTLDQLTKFENYSSQILSAFSYPIERHVLNTAGIDNYNDYQYNMVRLGIGLYGINAGENNIDVKPISKLKSVIIQTKKLKNGDSIGYGRKTIANENMTIAMLPIGYSDGLRRNLGNGKFNLYLNGKPCPIVGNICMDICMIDVTGLNAKVGDEVELFGNYNSIEDVAKAMNTIPYEVLTSISQRVKRVYYKD